MPLATRQIASTNHIAVWGLFALLVCCSALGPRPLRAKANNIRPEVAVVAKWQPNAAIVAVNTMITENQEPMYWWPRSPNVLPLLAKASKPAASVPKPTVWANITRMKSTPVRIRAPVSALGMLRLGSAVSSPSEAQASKPAHDRKADTTPASTRLGVTPAPKVKTEKSIPVVGAPPLPRMVTDRMTMAMMPTPSIAISTLATECTSRPATVAEMARPTSTVMYQEIWNGLSLLGCNSASSALTNAAVRASVPMAKPT